MKTSEPKPTKEEILAKWEGESADRLLDRFDYYERVIFPSMQEYAETYHKEKLREELKVAFKYNWSGNNYFSSGDFDTDFNLWYENVYLKTKQ